MDVRQQILEAFCVNLMYGRDLLEATPENEFCTVPVAGMNHPAWIAGHITLPHRRIATELGSPLEIPDGWVELFGRGSRPRPTPSLYPAKQVLIQAYLEGHKHLAAAFSAATSDQLSATNVRWKPTMITTIGAMAVHAMTTHEALHLGQLSAWRRAMGMPAIDVTGKA